MAWNTVINYDGAVTGGFPTFSRNVAAPDEAGTLQSANARRFAARDRYIPGAVAWSEAVDLGGTCTIVGSGPDDDGTPLFVVKHQGATQVDVYSLAGSDETLENSTLYSELPTATGTRTFTLKGACVHHGLIVITCERKLSGTTEGITLFTSQDRGATWSSIDHDSGGTDIPQISGAPTLVGCGREWGKCQAFPSGGIDADGNYSLLEAFFIGVDYCHKGSPQPSGGQCFLFRATRPDTSTSWTVEDTRLIYERWQTNYDVYGCHVHTAWVADPQNNQGVIVSLGDSSPNNRMDYIAIDLDNYLSATPVLTEAWHGEYSSSTDVAKYSPQPVSAVPGPGYCTLASGDVDFGIVLKIDAAPSASSDPSLTYVVTQIKPSLGGINWDGSEPLWLGWYPGRGYASGNFDTNDWSSSLDPTKHYSPDGIQWSQIPGVENSVNSVMCLCGDWLISVRSSDDMLMVAELPKYTQCKPLLIAPGAANLMTEFTERTAPATGNTNVAVNWSVEDGYTYDSDGSAVPNAPSAPPPDPNGILREIAAVGTTNYAVGHYWYQESGSTIDGTGNVASPAWLHVLDPTAEATLSNVLGVSGDYYNSERAFSFADNNKWHAVPTVTTIGTEARGHVAPKSGQTSSRPSLATFLVCYGGMYESDEIPYPVANDAGSNPHELESLGSLTSSSEWSVAYQGFMPWMSTATDRTLMTVYRDASNYVTVTWDESATTLSFTPTVAASPQTAIDIVTKDWVHGWPLQFVLSDDGTDLEVTVLSIRAGLQHGTSAGNSIGGSPATVKLASEDETTVSAQEVGLLAYDTQFHGQTYRSQLLTNFDFSAPDLITGLLVHWKLDEAAGGTTVSDSSGNGVDGVITSGTLITGPGPRGGTAIYLDGSHHLWNSSQALAEEVTFPMTKSFAFRKAAAEDAVSVYGMTVVDRSVNNKYFGSTIPSSESPTVTRRNTTISTAGWAGVDSFELDRWYYVCEVYDADGETVDLYIDGEFVSSADMGLVVSPDSDFDGIAVGTYRHTTPANTAIAVSDVRLYNRALTAAEIRLLGKVDTDGGVVRRILKTIIQPINKRIQP